MGLERLHGGGGGTHSVPDPGQISVGILASRPRRGPTAARCGGFPDVDTCPLGTGPGPKPISHRGHAQQLATAFDCFVVEAKDFVRLKEGLAVYKKL